MPRSQSTYLPGTGSIRDEEQIMTKPTPRMKPQTNMQRKTATEEPPWDGRK